MCTALCCALQSTCAIPSIFFKELSLCSMSDFCLLCTLYPCPSSRHSRIYFLWGVCVCVNVHACARTCTCVHVHTHLPCIARDCCIMVSELTHGKCPRDFSGAIILELKILRHHVVHAWLHPSPWHLTRLLRVPPFLQWIWVKRDRTPKRVIG